MRNLTKTCLLGILSFFVLSNAPLMASTPFDVDLDVKLSDKATTTGIDGIITITSENTASTYSKDLISRTEANAKAENSEYPCEGTVNCKYAQNVRRGPWGEIVTTFKPGTKINIVGKDGDWYKVSYNGGIVYLHYSLVDTPTTPAYDGTRPYAYGTAKATTTKSGSSSSSSSTVAKTGNSSTKSTTTTQTTSVPASSSNKSINGPEIPDCILKGIAAAKKTKWYTTQNKCLQYAGTVAYKAGAHVSEKNSIYPHNAYTPDKTLRGKTIDKLDDAAREGILKPGMLIHVKAAYDKDPAYNPNTNAHHWFMYVGMQNGVPMFHDTLKSGSLKTADEMARIMKTGNITQSQYKNYGNIRRVSAVYDPFADQR